jgi:hypothetical protein
LKSDRTLSPSARSSRVSLLRFLMRFLIAIARLPLLDDASTGIRSRTHIVPLVLFAFIRVRKYFFILRLPNGCFRYRPRLAVPLKRMASSAGGGGAPSD